MSGRDIADATALKDKALARPLGEADVRGKKRIKKMERIKKGH